LAALKNKTQKKISGESAEEILEKIQIEITRQLEEFGRILLNGIIPALSENGIWLYYNAPIKQEHKEEVLEIFLSQVLSFIQPILLDGKNKFQPENNQLYFTVGLKKPTEELIRHAIVNIPSDKLPRFFTLSMAENKEHVIFIDDIIRENIQMIFPGFEILSIFSFKINRDAELNLEEDYNIDIVNKIEKELSKRKFGPPSRFLFETGMPQSIQLFLTSVLDLRLDEIFPGGRYHNLRDFATFPTFGRNLAYAKFEPVRKNFSESADIFNLITSKDVLIHLPYQSYNPILSFFNQAVIDPDVTEIYIALYRVASESHIANALISAAKNNKKVTVFLELKARFDEANNIQWSRRMKEAGVKIIYSIPGIKVHSKIALVRKKEKNRTVNYSVLSTGNFNETTARVYTDHVLLSADELVGRELLQLFQFLQERRLPRGSKELKFQKLLVSRFNMIERFEQLTQKEIKKVKNGGEGTIRIKLNNLEEPGMINTLYEASQAGVKIELIVRSICCLIPSAKGISENIVAKRIVDRYLEHSRIFIFGANDSCEVIIGSADWMTRNLHRRIEVCVPVTDPHCKRELLDYFELQWNDNDKAVVINDTMEQQLPSINGDVVNAQTAIYNYIKEKV
ncbi:MAG TPA: polyphosphate kinase 1, partial [Chitinophagaceae bacterium]|nr:polyphosphate kinase 1 [Chitinophagaceae bacterium]